MQIDKCLPFDCCERCQEFILKVDEQAIFTENRRIEVVLKVYCKNEYLCKHLKKVLKYEE